MLRIKSALDEYFQDNVIDCLKAGGAVRRFTGVDSVGSSSFVSGIGPLLNLQLGTTLLILSFWSLALLTLMQALESSVLLFDGDLKVFECQTPNSKLFLIILNLV